MVIEFKASAGNLANSRVTVQNGEAAVTFISETENSKVAAKIDAQINEASNDYKALIGKVFGTTNVLLDPSPNNGSNNAIVVGAESDIADRVTLHFNKEVSVKNFVKQNPDGTYMVDKDGNAVTYGANEGGYVVAISQPGTGKTFKARGFKPGTDAKSMVVILTKGKDTTLTDNTTVNVDITDATGVKSAQSFVLTDPRPAEPTNVTPTGLTGVNVVFSEPIVDPVVDLTTQQVSIDGGKLDLLNMNYTAPAKLISTGDFDQNKFTDTRNVLTVTFGKYINAVTATNSIDGKAHKAGEQVFLPAGNHSIQLAAIKDFAGYTDTKNISTTQVLNFAVQGNDVVPAVASVVAESPEQFRVKFNCDVAGTPAMALYAYNSSGKYDLFTNVDIDTTNGKLIDPTNGSILDVKKVTDSEYIVQLKEDWTKIYKTQQTNKNYYNGKYALHFEAKALVNPANGKDSGDAFDAPITGTAIANPDTTSPVIKDIVQAHDKTPNAYDVIMSEPVKVGILKDGVATSADGTDTIAQTQGKLQTTTVQFLGKDADGNTVTVDGIVTPYGDTADATAEAASAGDTIFKVSPNTVGGKTIQQLVDNGTYQGTWTVVVKSISDDVGNTAATLTKAFVLSKAPTSEDFYVNDKAKTNIDNMNLAAFKIDPNGAGEDKLYVTFTEPVTITGNTENATNVSNYTIDGNLLPKGSYITLTNDIDGDDGVKDNTIVISLPDGTLSNADKHTLVVAKSLKSANGTAYNTNHAVQFVLPSIASANNVINSLIGGTDVASTTMDKAGNVVITSKVAATSTLASIGAVNATNLTNAINNGAEKVTLGATTLDLKATAPNDLKMAIAKAVTGNASATAADFDTLTIDQLKTYANAGNLKVTVSGVVHSVTVQSGAIN
ncbi:hypothetical protein HBE96_21255 [Clostridium sp. P21]|uniref:Uncharacterized protein n=1 Tax=Clostridium muellerianum TaxID=2716538 RepID=A0A7Y0HRE5_9CLOT|nr:hypothetical protein [Clostridium muellerianum]NMM65116.1 hypothetical protein [Clostridium muellerianum]